jgi:WD40 repeat protein
VKAPLQEAAAQLDIRISKTKTRGLFGGCTVSCYGQLGYHVLQERGNVRLWEVGSGEILQTLERQGGPVTSLAFSPDGKLLASGSFDKTLRLWGVEQTVP